MKIKTADVTFNPSGTPVAQAFDDVYFNDGNGVAETDYVFIKQNNLWEKWLNHNQSHFVIAETGFGTGLNFLRTWQVFTDFLHAHPEATCRNLYFISTEKFPLTLETLAQALECYPTLDAQTQALIEVYPQTLEGCHRLHFGHVICDIWLGDVHDTLPTIACGTQGLVDAWFLDGFAPSKNPDMWQDTLFAQMARLSKINASVATFTAAGLVKRGLQQAGFVTEKVKGFGRKREMLTATFTPEHDVSSCAYRTITPYFDRYRRDDPQPQGYETIHIIGGGIASASLAYECVCLGLKVKLYCKDPQLAQAASGNAIAGFYPQLNADAGHNSQLQAHSFLYASRMYRSLAKTQSFAHDWCGVLLLGFNDKVCARQANLVKKGVWPDTLIYPVDERESSQIANVTLPYSGLFIPEGGWVNPPSLVQAFIQKAQSMGDCEVVTDYPITSDVLEPGARHTFLPDASHALVLCAGHDSASWLPHNTLPLRVVRGQVEALPVTQASAKLATVLCHKGYFTPAVDGYHACGSTYTKDDVGTDYRAEDAQTNLATHQKALTQAPWMQAFTASTKGRAAVRCSTPDHNPIVGALPHSQTQRQELSELYKAFPSHQYPQGSVYPNTFIFGGLGSRGLTTAPLLANVLASQLAGSPLPLPQHLLNALAPNRFLIRDLIRQQP
jgi:tRNA 5-methylaminomethyl-2-thiouridine biosynthesis bifunctional protein